jgi:hypothetical protein
VGKLEEICVDINPSISISHSLTKENKNINGQVEEYTSENECYYLLLVIHGSAYLLNRSTTCA